MWSFLTVWLAYFCGGLRLVASLWTPHAVGMVAWWPHYGWAIAALLIIPIVLCVASFALRHTGNPAPTILRLFWLLAGLCVFAIGYDSLSRTEVYRDGLVLHQPFKPDRRYGADQMVSLEVGCFTGSRGSPDPELVVTTVDGATIDVAEQATTWNGPRRADWLAAAETVTAMARTRHLWRVSVNRDGQSNIYTGCMRGLAERFPEPDRGRVIALFSPTPA